MNKETKNFLQAVQYSVEYWATLDKRAFESAMKYQGITEEQYRLDGLAFSILCIIDGVDSLNGFHGYDMKFRNRKFNDEYLHDLFGQFRQKPLEDK